MTGSLVYLTLLDVLRKDVRGLSLSVDEFNRLSVIVKQRIIADYFSKSEEDIGNSFNIGIYKKFGQIVTLSAGIGTLPSDCYETMGEPYYTDAGSVVRYFDIVTTLERVNRERNYLTKATLKHPICEIGSKDANGHLQIYVYPTTGIASIKVDYKREPLTPFLDYYVNNITLGMLYMTAGTSYTVASGYAYRDGTTGIKNSLTVDWDFNEIDLPLIISYFRQEVGATLPDEGMVTIGMKDKSEILLT